MFPIIFTFLYIYKVFPLEPKLLFFVTSTVPSNEYPLAFIVLELGLIVTPDLIGVWAPVALWTKIP